MNETPDSWIERNPDDDGRPRMSDAEMCEEGLCDHAGHCEVCERPTGYPLEDGVCRACEIAWLSKRLLTFPAMKQIARDRMLTGEEAAANAAVIRKIEAEFPPAGGMRAIDSMTPEEIEVLHLKGML